MTVKIRTLLFAVLVAIAAALAVGTARADVSQTPLATACPAGYQHLFVYKCCRCVAGSADGHGTDGAPCAALRIVQLG